jgi:hypothetical protein
MIGLDLVIFDFGNLDDGEKLEDDYGRNKQTL